MIEHVSVPVRDLKKAKRLYTAALAPLGYKITRNFEGAAGFMEGGHTSLWIVEKKRMIPIHIAILARSKASVRRFYEAALRAGAKDHGSPGFRIDYGPDYYAAFVLDFEGNNIEACYFGERAKNHKRKP